MIAHCHFVSLAQKLICGSAVSEKWEEQRLPSIKLRLLEIVSANLFSMKVAHMYRIVSYRNMKCYRVGCMTLTHVHRYTRQRNSTIAFGRLVAWILMKNVIYSSMKFIVIAFALLLRRILRWINQRLYEMVRYKNNYTNNNEASQATIGGGSGGTFEAIRSCWLAV